MEHAPVITGLLAKREEIGKQMAELERQIRKHKAEIAQIDGTIGLFSPGVVAAKREATRTPPKPLAANGTRCARPASARPPRRTGASRSGSRSACSRRSGARGCWPTTR